MEWEAHGILPGMVLDALVNRSTPPSHSPSPTGPRQEGSFKNGSGNNIMRMVRPPGRWAVAAPGGVQVPTMFRAAATYH